MKKAKEGKRGTTRKSEPAKKITGRKAGAAKTVEGYLARIPEPSRSALTELRAAIRAAAPAESVEVISYGIPALKHQKIIVWYAAFQNHCTLFPTAAIIEQFSKELKKFQTSKGGVRFTAEKPLPATLVKRMVRARVAQIAQKAVRSSIGKSGARPAGRD